MGAAQGTVGNRPRVAEGRRGRALLQAYARNKAALLGIVLVMALLIIAAAAGVIAPYDPNHQDYSSIMQPPSWRHPCGTDEIGRDQLSRIIYGARVSLGVATAAVGISAAVGVLLGLVAGHFTAWIDEAIMRLTDALWAFPSLLLAIGIASALGRGVASLIVALGAIGVAGITRLVRGQVLVTRELDYVMAARSAGSNEWRVLRLHVWPNVITPALVAISTGIATAILNESSLSFLGIGIRPPTPSWGSMLRSGYNFMNAAVWLSIFPGLAIVVAVLGFTLLSDGLQIILDPRLRYGRQGP
jgi:peptide/nickel transport system permease protein